MPLTWSAKILKNYLSNKWEIQMSNWNGYLYICELLNEYAGKKIWIRRSFQSWENFKTSALFENSVNIFWWEEVCLLSQRNHQGRQRLGIPFAFCIEIGENFAAALRDSFTESTWPWWSIGILHPLMVLVGWFQFSGVDKAQAQSPSTVHRKQHAVLLGI